LAQGVSDVNANRARRGWCHADPKADKLFAAQLRNPEDASHCQPPLTAREVPPRRRGLSDSTRASTGTEVAKSLPIYSSANDSHDPVPGWGRCHNHLGVYCLPALT